MANRIKRMAMILIGGLLGLALTTGIAIAAKKSGDWVIAIAYCRTDNVDFMKYFTAIVVKGGGAAYNRIIRLPKIPCIDARIHIGARPVRVVLVKKMWTFTLPNRQVFDMWKVKDRGGATGFTWITVPGQLV